MWNYINVQSEGIKDFRLDFFNSLNTLISSSPTFLAPLGQVLQQNYIFSQIVPNVSRVDLVVLNSHPFTFNRIDIREVAFTGSPSGIPVPEPSAMLGLFAVSSLGLGSLSRRKGK